jgi:hypothetical protein
VLVDGIGFAGMAYTPGGNGGGSGRMLLSRWIYPETPKSRLAGTLDVFKVHIHILQEV